MDSSNVLLNSLYKYYENENNMNKLISVLKEVMDDTSINFLNQNIIPCICIIKNIRRKILWEIHEQTTIFI